LGHKFSLILSREITHEESEILQGAGCYGATFATGSLPTDPDVRVTQVDIDDTVSPSLEKAIESGLEAVKKVPELGVPGLTVPALPVEKKAGQPGVVAGEVIDEPSVGNEEETDEASAKGNGKASVKQAGNGNGRASAKQAANGNGKASTKQAASGRASAKRTTNRKTVAKAESADDAKKLSEASSTAD
jgi:hypothetical protein